MRNKKFYIIHFTFFIIFTPIILIFLGCTSSTGSATGNIIGTIHLENQEDHSGIVVGIYELAELDPDIVEANTKWPHIGVKITQHTEFDHRFGILVKTGETDASGSFEIADIPTGVYNVVAIKDGFGFRYIYEISISEGDNSLSNLMKQSPLNDCFEVTDKNFEMNNQPAGGQVEECKMNNESLSSTHYSLSIIHSTLDSKADTQKADLILFPETIITTDITEATTFESYHHYIIEQDIIVDDELTIEPGAVIRLNEGVKMSIYGDLTAVGEEDKFIWFTSNDSIYTMNAYKYPQMPTDTYNKSSFPQLALYNRIELNGSLDKEVAWCKFDWANCGLFNHINGFEISDCIFRRSNCGFKAESVNSAFCSNLLCEDITNEDGGIYFGSSVDGGDIKNNVCSNCVSGIKIFNHSNPAVKNNYITNCIYGIDVSYNSSPNIQNNEIFLSECGVKTIWSHPIIMYNIINSEIGIYCYYNYIEMNYNNIFCDTYAIELGYYHEANGIDINAQNNYFYTTSEEEIQQLIYDKNDVDESQQEHIGIVYYNPFLTHECPYAGIQESTINNIY